MLSLAVFVQNLVDLFFVGVKWISDPCDVPHLPEGPGEEEQESPSRKQCQLSDQLQQPTEPRREHAGAIQAVHGVAEDATPKVIRQVKNALKKAIGFWKTIQQVLSFHETDDDTVSRKLKQLNEEIFDDLVRNPRGSKRTKAVAEAMHLELRSLKTIAEIYNPGCFGKLSHKHGLEAGKAFDLSLGTDLLDGRNREHVREYIKTIRPGLVLIAPPCHMYSQLQNILKEFREQDPIAMRRYLEKKSKAKTLLNFGIEIAELCRELGLTFVLEHPWSSESWSTKMMERLLQHSDVFISRTDQCMFGLKSVSGNLHRKRTGFALASWSPRVRTSAGSAFGESLEAPTCCRTRPPEISKQPGLPWAGTCSIERTGTGVPLASGTSKTLVRSWSPR